MTRHTFLLIAGLMVTTVAVCTPAAHAGSEKPSAILIFPRVEVDTAQGVDTTVQISNHGMTNVGVFCFYVNGLGVCGAGGTATCRTSADCPASVACVEQCQERNFIFNLTRGQTLGFPASQGLIPPVIDIPPGSIPSTQTDPFFGELKCVQVDPTMRVPVAGNDLIGTATIMHTAGPDAAGYSAIGIESTGRNNGDGTLCLGSNASGDCPAAEYVRCPQALDLNHFFEGATVAGAQIENELTLVPCSQRLDQPLPPVTNQVELIVVNEFEERRCGMFSVGCIGDIRFANHPLFSVGVQGSLAGHTRLRAPIGAEDDVGHALLGVALERHVAAAGATHSAAHHLTSEESSAQADFIRFSLPPPLTLSRSADPKLGGNVSIPTLLRHHPVP